MNDIFRKDWTVYVRESDGSESVLFHLGGPNSYQLANVDKLIELALIPISEAPPAHMFFE